MSVPTPPPAPGTAPREYSAEEVPAGFPAPEADDEVTAVHGGPLVPPTAQEVEETEVEFKNDIPQDFDQAPQQDRPQGQAEDPRDTLDEIVPKAEPHLWVIGPEHDRREYVQKPLSFIGKMQWFSLIGDALDKALTGPNAISLNSLFDAPGRPGELRAQDFRDADTFVQAIGKLLAVAPNFLVDSYCIWLNVEDYDRKMVADMMKLPEDEGGLSDDMGMEIIEVFLDQNYDSLASFFGERIGKLQRRVEALNKVRAARVSRRSKR